MRGITAHHAGQVAWRRRMAPDPVSIMHISCGGPERWLSCAGRLWVFEDHPYCGPIVLTGKTRDPAKTQPPENSIFWQHVNAWYS